MTVANLIYRYTHIDDTMITVEFICGAGAQTDLNPDVLVRCDECIAGDFSTASRINFAMFSAAAMGITNRPTTTLLSGPGSFS